MKVRPFYNIVYSYSWFLTLWMILWGPRDPTFRVYKAEKFYVKMLLKALCCVLYHNCYDIKALDNLCKVVLCQFPLNFDFDWVSISIGFRFRLDFNFDWITISIGFRFRLNYDFSWISISIELRFRLEDYDFDWISISIGGLRFRLDIDFDWISIRWVSGNETASW